jgi:hypothetical protein
MLSDHGRDSWLDNAYLPGYLQLYRDMHLSVALRQPISEAESHLLCTNGTSLERMAVK